MNLHYSPKVNELLKNMPVAMPRLTLIKKNRGEEKPFLVVSGVYGGVQYIANSDDMILIITLDGEEYRVLIDEYSPSFASPLNTILGPRVPYDAYLQVEGEYPV